MIIMYNSLSAIVTGLSLSLMAFNVSPAAANPSECLNCCKSDQNMGVVSFTSNITSAGPLTWSVQSYSDQDGQNHSLTDFGKLFYLSTPPSLNLSAVEDYSGCGLALHGIAGALQVNQSLTTSTGLDSSCDTVMSLQCQRDITAAVEDILEALLSPANATQEDYYNVKDLDEMCTKTLPNSFTSLKQIPPSCSFSNTVSNWGFPAGGPIARGGDAAGKMITTDQQKCLTTSNSTYNTQPAMGGYIPALPHSKEAKDYLTGMTPVFSMFFNLPGQPRNASFLSTPEVKLSCVRTFPNEQQESQINSAGSQRSSLHLPLFVLAVIAVMMSFA